MRTGFSSRAVALVFGAASLGLAPGLHAQEAGLADQIAQAIEAGDTEALGALVPGGTYQVVGPDFIDSSFDQLLQAVDGCDLAESEDIADRIFLTSAGWLCTGQTMPDDECFTLGYLVMAMRQSDGPALAFTEAPTYSYERCGQPTVRSFPVPPPPSQ